MVDGGHGPFTLTRPRLDQRLANAVHRRLTSVVAGAGFGKTTLLTAWAAGTTSAWHSLTPSDRTLGVIVRAVTDALRARVPGLPPDLVAAVSGPRGPDTGTDEAGRAQAYAGRICEALAERQARDLVLVLDDVEAIDGAAESTAFVAGLCRQAPTTLHVVLSSRRDPPFPVARLRGQGLVLDLSASDLAFTPEETAQVVRSALGEEAGPQVGAGLHELTGGWPAAVRLAAEALAHDPAGNTDAALARLRRPGGVLHDYLGAEVVGAESAETQDLLARLAVLDRFTPDLAATLGPAASAGALAALVRRGLIVDTPGPGQPWLTLSALVRGVVSPVSSEARAETLTAAARWFEDHGQAADALRCLLSAGSAGATARLVTTWGPDLLQGGETDAVLDAIAQVEGERPLVVHRLEGDARQLSGDWDGALVCYDRATGGREALEPGLAWHMGLIHHLRGDLTTALAIYARGDLDTAGADPTDEALLVAWTATAHWLRGDGDRCRELADDAMDRARRSRDDRALAAAHTVQALVAALEGDRLANDGHYLRALDHAERAGDLLQIIRIRLNRGSRLNEEGFYAEAIAELDLAIGLADLGGYAALKGIALGNRGEAHWRLGRFELAIDDLDRAVAIFQRLGSLMVAYPLGLVGDVHAARGRTALARAAFSEAADVGRRSSDMQSLVPALSGLARLLAEDDPAAARALADEAVACGPVLGHVDALIAQAHCALVAGDTADAAAITARAEEVAGERRDRAALAEVAELRAATAPTPAAGEAALAEALALWDDLGIPLGRGRVLLAQARLGGPEAQARARAAGNLLRPLGARRLAAEAERLANATEAAATPAAPGSPASPAVAVAVPPLAIQCLGGFAVLRDGEPVTVSEWKSRKARDLVKVLISREGRPVHRGMLVDLLWPDEDPARTGSRLSVTLSTARAVLDPAKAFPPNWYLAADSDAVWLDVEHAEVDVLRFTALAAQATAERKAGASAAAVEALAAAEAAYVGDAFTEDPYEDWSVSMRERARATYISVARTLADDTAAAGDTATAVRCYLRVLEHDPYDEHAHLGLVATQLGAGQQGEARRSYRAYGQRMDELGVEAAPFPSLVQA
ncbi:MAG TPA: BTAD domain-containing putative transcriptional regulator [Acidimicrobiales bacterium]|nr:BTAD domain-containing putative transcriptional regulator [Acidimicrobiales bacterium]